MVLLAEDLFSKRGLTKTGPSEGQLLPLEENELAADEEKVTETGAEEGADLTEEVAPPCECAPAEVADATTPDETPAAAEDAAAPTAESDEQPPAEVDETLPAEPEEVEATDPGEAEPTGEDVVKDEPAAESTDPLEINPG